MILLLDNFDSFVHNLARYFRRIGCETVVVRSGDTTAQSCIAMCPDAVVISPGPGRPEQAGCSIDVIREVPEQVPILGVCLGHQAIGVAFGGVVHRCGPVHGSATEMTHDGKGVFTGCPSPMKVGRYHALAIDPQHVPDDLQVSATGADGVIMGVRHRKRPVFGVQFHPESVLTEHGLTMVQNFASLATPAKECVL